MVERTNKGSLSIDFDGVINSYKSGFVAIDEIPDPPVEGSLEAIEAYIKHGFKVYIFSTRNSSADGIRAIFNWLVKWGMPLEVIDMIDFPAGKPVAKLYIDDRGYQFTGEFPSVEYVENFLPWHGGKSSSQK